MGQGSGIVEEFIEIMKLPGIGQTSKQQQVRGFFIAQPMILLKTVDDIKNTDPAIIQLALDRDFDVHRFFS